MKISGGKIILTAVVLCCCVGASDRSKSDPFAAIPEAERKDLATHLNGYISRLIPADWTDLNAHNDPPQAFVLVGSFSDLLHLRTLADALLRRSADLPVISGASQEGHARLALNEEDEQAAWEPVVVLHYRATPEVLAAAERLCFSYVSKERVLGANILGQLGVPERTFPEDCFRILCEMLGREQDPLVIEAIGVAFSPLHDKRAIPLLAPFSKHPDKEVRLGVVQGLSKHPDATAIATLIELTKDEDEDVPQLGHVWFGHAGGQRHG